MLHAALLLVIVVLSKAQECSPDCSPPTCYCFDFESSSQLEYWVVDNGTWHIANSQLIQNASGGHDPCNPTYDVNFLTEPSVSPFIYLNFTSSWDNYTITTNITYTNPHAYAIIVSRFFSKTDYILANVYVPPFFATLFGYQFSRNSTQF